MFPTRVQSWLLLMALFSACCLCQQAHSIDYAHLFAREYAVQSPWPTLGF